MTPAEVIAHYRSAVANGKLLVQQCRRCHVVVHYPRVICPNCRGLELEWKEACGLGTVYSFSIVAQPPSARWKDRVPYVLALIDLQEGPRMMSNIIGCEPDEVRCGMPVTVAFEERDDRVLVQFKRAEGAEHGG